MIADIICIWIKLMTYIIKSPVTVPTPDTSLLYNIISTSLNFGTDARYIIPTITGILSRRVANLYQTAR